MGKKGFVTVHHDSSSLSRVRSITCSPVCSEEMKEDSVDVQTSLVAVCVWGYKSVCGRGHSTYLYMSLWLCVGVATSLYVVLTWGGRTFHHQLHTVMSLDVYGMCSLSDQGSSAW